MRLKLFTTLLHLTAVLCNSQYSYYVNDTIGTDVFHTTADDFYIYNLQLEDCHVFKFSDGELSFNRVYDFNLEFKSLNFTCPFILNTSSVETIRVFVTDTNDHAPLFSAGEYSLSVDEQVLDQVSQTSVILPAATDPDLWPNNVQNYSLSGNKDDLEYFYFNSNVPTLRPTGTPPIDREIRASFHFNLTASDGGTPPRISSVISIIILINDINDNSPVFLPHNSSFRFDENSLPGSILGVFPAEDNDTGDSGNIVYRLSSERAYKGRVELSSGNSSIFQINASSGQVELFGNLDFEQFDKIAFIVEATDSGQPPLSNSIVVIVFIDDLFDSLPQLILTNTYPGNVFKVAENSDPALNFLLIFLKSTLANATASLALLTYPDNSTDTQPFSIIPVLDNWVFKLKERLDREIISQYEFTLVLEVNFSLASSQSSLTRLTVQVLDVNDESPQFQNPPSGCVPIEENSTGLILTLEVLDSDTGSNAELTFSISISPPEYQEHFAIDSGELRVTAGLDYELVQNLDLNVTVTDSGTPPLTNSTAWSVCITNINDSPIEFNLPNHSLFVPFNSLLYTKLFTVHAFDKDNLSAPIFHHLVGHNGALFLLSTTGDLTLASCLQQRQVTQLQVSASHCPIATDFSAQCEVSRTNITVYATEMVSPLLQSSYTVCLPKDNKSDSVPLFSLGTTNLNASHFHSSFESSLFTENNHVYLKYNLSLLQETCSEYLSCNITVSHACNRNHTEYTYLNFLFVEEILSPVQFSQSSYYIFRKEGDYINSTVLDLSRFLCSDFNGAIHFSLSGVSAPPNLALVQSGLLVLDGTLDIDFANATTNYTFSIEATDIHVTASATVLFQIIATNDNSPQFFSPIDQLTLNSSYHAGQYVARFTAEDKDLGSDTQFSYALSIALDWLVTDELTGVILISKSINPDTNFSKENTFNGTITVSDGGSPPRNTSRFFVVIIGNSFKLVSPPSYWYIPVAAVCSLLLVLIVLVVVVLIMVAFCRYKFLFCAKLRLDSTKSSRVWEVVENNNVAYVCGSVKHNQQDAIVDSISKSTKSSGFGISIDSSPTSLVPMTEEEIRDIMYRNRDLLEEPGSTLELEDYNVESPAPPTLSGVDSNLHLAFGDEISQVSIFNVDKYYYDESPIDIIFSNAETPSHSPQSSASSSYLSSVSHQRPRFCYKVPHHREAEKKSEVRLTHLPSASTPSFSQKVLALAQQRDNSHYRNSY